MAGATGTASRDPGRGALFLNQLNKRIDDLRSDVKDGQAKLEARQETIRAEQREDNKALNEKLDRLLESRLPTPR